VTKRRISEWLSSDPVLMYAGVLVVASGLLLRVEIVAPLVAVYVGVVAYARRDRRRVDAYRRRIHRLIGRQRRTWETALKAFDALNFEPGWEPADIPERFVTEHRELTEIWARIREAQRSTGDLGDRARSALTDRQRWEELERAIAGAAQTEAERRYGEALQRVRLRRTDALAQLAQTGEASLEQLIGELETIRPPKPLAAVHSSYLDGRREALTAIRASNQANRRGDVPGAVDAGHRASDAWTKMNQLGRVIGIHKVSDRDWAAAVTYGAFGVIGLLMAGLTLATDGHGPLWAAAGFAAFGAANLIFYMRIRAQK
jgi:hypothetical protein